MKAYIEKYRMQIKGDTSVKNKKTIIIVSLLAILIVACAGFTAVYFKIMKPHNTAVAFFYSAVETVNAKNTELDNAMRTLQSLIDSKEEPLDETALSEAKTALSVAGDAKINVPDIPQKTEDINRVAEELNDPIDYSAEIEALNTAAKALKDSIQQMKQLINPSEQFVVSRLQRISNLLGIQAVTEDNDPNGNLNKAGGYTAAIYFASGLIDQKSVFGADIVDKGTDCGGCVEVYATKEDAESRNAYLATFDGATFLNTGSHRVIGTLVIRTSNLLTATQQNELEAHVINAMSKLED